MQRFARWNNLVETTFLLAPTRRDASYGVRIFTPHQEIAFASHPSIGSAHALLECGLAQPRNGRLWQECGAGILPVRVEGEGASRCLLLRPPPEQIVRTGLGAHPLLPAALHHIQLGALPPAPVAGGRKWCLRRLRTKPPCGRGIPTTTQSARSPTERKAWASVLSHVGSPLLRPWSCVPSLPV